MSYEHAIEYPQIDQWQDRVIALQVRVLMDDRAAEVELEFPGTQRRIHDALMRSPEHQVLLPTLQQVQEMELILNSSEVQSSGAMTSNCTELR